MNTIDITTPRTIERTANGWRVADGPLLVDEPMAKATQGEPLPVTMGTLLTDYVEHVASGVCSWNDSGNRPSLVELTNHYCDCRGEPFDHAQVLAHALLGRITGSGRE